MKDGFDNLGLINNEERFFTLIHKSTYGYVEFDLEGNITFANDSASSLSGYTLDDRVNVKELIVQEDLQRAITDLQLVLEETNAGPREYRFKRKDGAVLDIEVNTLPIHTDGRIVGFQSTILDISKRKNTERKLAENELKYRRLFEHLKEGIIISDKNGMIEEANPSAAAMLGYNVTELIGKPTATIYADVRRRKKVFDLLMKQHSLKDYEMPLKKKDGTIIYAKGSATLHQDERGDVLKVEGTFFDITDQKKIEKELIESERNYRTLVESTKDLIFRGEPNGNIVFMNQAVEHTLGFTKEELFKMNTFKGVHTDDLPRVKREFASLLQGHGISNLEMRYQVKDGSYVDVSINAEPVFNVNGKISGFAGIARDMTALKNAERELKKSRTIAEAYMEATTDAAVMIDLNGTIVDLNVEFTRRFEKDKKQLRGENIFRLFPTDVATRRREMGKQVIQTGKPLHVQDERDGWWNEASIHPLFDDNGNVAYLVIFTHDITDFKKMEKQLIESRNELEKKVLKRTAELEEVNTALRVLIKGKDSDVKDMEDRVLLNIGELIIPNLEELKNASANKKQEDLVDIIKMNLTQITAPFINGNEFKYVKLTPSEIKVANLVKQGKTNKEIAELYHLSARTVESHRDRIREKIGIKNKKVNLRTYLMSNE